MTTHKEVSREQWLKARLALLEEEKAFNRQRDALSAKRQALPWVRVDVDYTFHTDDGERSLAQLFAAHSQLIVYHFMLGPDWQAGCKSCSFWADNFNGFTEHLAGRDVKMLAISRAPLANINAYKQRMGWRFGWVSSLGSRFNFDYGVSFGEDERKAATYNYRTTAVGEELPGISVFAKDNIGAVFHTYSTYSRGLDMLNAAYHYLDLVPKGRDESELDFSMAWLRRRDEYEG
ncbi:MAG: DUF899 domain-containing protein [Myxococcales bacterium]|nr:DUF899 domain-containing protein [Myxococcales bacterium]